MKLKVFNRFTPINEEWLIKTLESHPDIKIIIDSKIDPIGVLDRIVKLNNNTEIDLNNVIIPQIYSLDMWKIAKEKYSFKEYIYTNYISHYSAFKIISNFNDMRIIAITLPISSINSNKSYLSRYKPILVHTPTNSKEISFARRMGSSGFYVDTPDIV